MPDASRQVSKQPPWRLLRPLTEAAATAGVHLLPLAQLHIVSLWLKPAKNKFTDSMGFHNLFSSNSQEIYIISVSGECIFIQWTLVIVNSVLSPILFTNERCLLFSM